MKFYHRKKVIGSVLFKAIQNDKNISFSMLYIFDIYIIVIILKYDRIQKRQISSLICAYG